MSTKTEFFRRRNYNFLFFFIALLFCNFFNLVTNFPLNETSSSSTVTSLSTEASTEEEEFEIQNFTENLNFSTSNYEEEEVPTLGTVTCDAWYEQLCENGIECILKQFMCDGRRDCTDGSDEISDVCQHQRVEEYPDSKGRFLPPVFKCPDTWFFCKDASRCIEPASVCNGLDNCTDGSDEGGFCHYLNVERRLFPSSSENINNETAAAII